jgi:hypothetical protein
MLGKDRFASLLLNKNIAPGLLLDASMIKKANSDEKRRKNKEAAIKRVKDGTHNFITSPYKKTEEDRKKLSQRMKGNNIGSKRKMTDEYRALAAKNSRGNTNVRGSRWWTNGVVYKRAKECPGDDFYLGSPPQSEETKRKRSLALTGNKNRRIQNKT